mmetsp:Transcript_134/g.178  ORF Transcript_134/g.178 Transcript_134/m.178 type:complete len:320 (-) Transcript_134:136-1095(-)
MAASKPHLRHVRNRAVRFALGDCKTFMESIPSCTRLKSRGISTTEIEIPSSQALFVQAKAPRMGTLSIPKILVQDSSLGVSVVAVEMILVEGKTKKTISFDFNFAVDNCLKIAMELAQEIKDSSCIQILPKHVEFIAKRLEMALEDPKETFVSNTELNVRMELEELLMQADITTERETVLESMLENGVTASDLLDGELLSDDDLKSIVPKLGPRKRLLRLVRASQRERQVSQGIMRKSCPTLDSLVTTLSAENLERDRAVSAPDKGNSMSQLAGGSTMQAQDQLPVRILTRPPSGCRRIASGAGGAGDRTSKQCFRNSQ